MFSWKYPVAERSRGPVISVSLCECYARGPAVGEPAELTLGLSALRPSGVEARLMNKKLAMDLCFRS